MDTNKQTPHTRTGNTSVPGAAPRLPCRGCIKSCPDYHRCEGKPWSMGSGASANQDQ
jgi:hypothetical protein